MKWIPLVLWIIAGAITIFDKQGVSRFSYICCWASLILYIVMNTMK